MKVVFLELTGVIKTEIIPYFVSTFHMQENVELFLNNIKNNNFAFFKIIF